VRGLHFFFTLSKGLDDAQSFFGYACRPYRLFAFYFSLQYHVHTRHRRDYDEQKAVVVVYASFQSGQLKPVLPVWLFLGQIFNFWLFLTPLALFYFWPFLANLIFYVDLADKVILVDFWALADF